MKPAHSQRSVSVAHLRTITRACAVRTMRLFLYEVNQYTSGLSLLYLICSCCGFQFTLQLLQALVVLICAAIVKKITSKNINLVTSRSYFTPQKNPVKGSFFYQQIHWMMSYKRNMDEKPLGFSIGAAAKIQTIIGYFTSRNGMLGSVCAAIALIISIFIWRLREFEYSNSQLQATRHEHQSGFLLMSSLLHFVLNSVASIGFLAGLFLHGGYLVAVISVSTIGTILCAKESYVGCYYSGTDVVPRYFAPFIRLRPAMMSQVFSQLNAPRHAADILKRFIRRWRAQRTCRQRSEAQPNQVLSQSNNPDNIAKIFSR